MSRTLLAVALAGLCGSSAWAAGFMANNGASAHAANTATAANASTGTAGTTGTTTTTTTTGGTTTTTTTGNSAQSATVPFTSGIAQTQSTNALPLPPPPPASVNPLVNERNTIPPTPAPATAGLPATPQSPALPSAQGLSATTQNQLRPSPALDATQIASVQASLAAGGLYRGPIDGNMSGALRAAIRQYQAISGLPQTGDIDAETIARLQRSALAGSVGSNGNTSTAGNRAAAGDPFSTSGGVDFSAAGIGAQSVGTNGSGTVTMPFQLSAPLNTSPSAAPGVFVQP